MIETRGVKYVVIFFQINRKSKDDFNEHFNTVLSKVNEKVWFALKISIIFSHSTSF